MPPRSDLKAPTTNSIPQPFPDDVRQERRRKPHKTRDRAHRIHGPTLELPQSHINEEPTGRGQSNTQAGPPRSKHPKMHIPSTDSDVNQPSMPQGVRTRRGSLADQSQLAQQHAPSSGPIRSRRNQSRDQTVFYHSQADVSPPVHNTTTDYMYPPSSMESDSYPVQPSAPFNMQAPGQPQDDQTRHNLGYRPVMHDPARSHTALGSQQAHQDNTRGMYAFTNLARSREMQGHAPAPSDPTSLPSISALHHDLNQHGREVAPRYAVQQQQAGFPSNQQHQQVELHRPHHYPQRVHAASYGHNQSYPGQQQSREWDQVERVTDNSTAIQQNVYHPSHSHESSQQQYWPSHVPNSAPAVPLYEQQASAVGPIRRTAQQLQQHHRSHSMTSQPYERSSGVAHSRAASMSAMYPQHTSAKLSDHSLPMSSTISYAQSPPFPVQSHPLGLTFASHPGDQEPQVRQYNPPSKHYALVDRPTQSPTQHLASPVQMTTSHSISQTRSQQSPLGPAPGYGRFGSPGFHNEPERPVRETPPVASVHASGAEQETDYSTPASAFQVSKSLLGTPSAPAANHPSNAENTLQDEAPDALVEQYMAEGNPAGRKEKRKDPRPHKCLDCGKGFPRPSALATHMSVHSGDKPYNCPVVSCNKSFAVRSNARRHLKTHGIKLKARDRPSKGSSTKQPAETVDDDENDNETEDDTTTEQPTNPSSSTRHGISRIPVASLTKPPPDRGLGLASHRGHANLHTNVHDDPSGLGAALALFGDEHTGTVLERIDRSGKLSGEKRNRWEMEMSGGVKLRSSRKDLAVERSRRGLRSEEIISSAKRLSDGDETLQEDEDEGQVMVHELEEDALLRLCPVREEPSTPQMPQLDRADLDKLIAPPMAWDGFQKQKALQDAESRQLSLEQRLPFHTSAGPASNQTVPPGFSQAARRESTSTMMSSSTLKSTPPNGYNLPTGIQETGLSGSTFVRQGFSSADGHFPRGGDSEDETGQASSFLISSMRTSALVPTPPLTQPLVRDDASAHNGSNLATRDLSTPPARRLSHIGSFSSASPGSGSEGAVGSLRDDGTWVSASMNGFTNYARLRNCEPFDDLGLSSVQLALPLPTVQPQPISSPNGGGKREERDSYAVDIGAYPYHPYFFDRRPVLAGPAPPSHNATSWRSARLIST